MADKKIQIEVLDFETGDSLERVNIIDGGQFLATPVAFVFNGSGQPNPTTSATITLTTSGSGTQANPFVITGVSIGNAGAGYNSTIRILVTTVSGGSDVLSNADLQPVLSTGVIGQLDITDSQNFPLSLNFTVSDGKDLESRFGNFSKTFNLPATKNNNRIFQHIYNSQVLNTKNMYHLKDCRILVDSIEFFVGKIKLSGSTQDKNPKSYSCTIFGGNFSWVNEIKDKKLCDIEFATAGLQTYDYTTINNSWAKTQANSEIIYPLVSYGDFNEDNTLGGVNIYEENLPSYDWRGWFWVYNILKEIFKNIGFAIDSTFIETANFKKLITHFNFTKGNENALAEQKALSAEIHRVDASVSDFQMIVGTSGAFSGGTLINPIHGVFPESSNSAIDVILKYDTEISDSVNAYNTSTGKWTCPRTGRYKISASANILFGVNQASNGTFLTRMRIRLIKRDSSGTFLHRWNNTFYPNSGTSPTGNASFGYFPNQSITTQDNYGSQYVYFQEGETVEAAMRIDLTEISGTTDSQLRVAAAFGGIGGVNSFQNLVSTFKVEYDSQDLMIGQTFKLTDILPCNIKQIDFIKGISHMFNLQFYTDVQSKKVYIEPYNDFYGSANDALDWSSKVDYSKGIEDKYELGLNEEVIFKYKDDSNDKYAQYLNENENGNALENPLFAYYIDLGDKFPKGKKEFVNPLFAPTIQTWDNDCVHAAYNNGVLIPVMWSEVPPSVTIGFDSNIVPPVERPEKGYKYEPRIAYYHGQVNNPNNSNYVTRFDREISANNFLGSTSYPRATFVDFEDASFPSLSYNDETIEPPFSGTSTLVKGLYSTYYEKMIKQMLQSPRIRTVHMNLKSQDIINLDFRKLIFFDGSLWRINKIVDYSPAKNITTKVEVIQWFEV
tara:strand:+ start:101 stop:2782 length:2682 start_codon:yes stop_codon:yes gene_type:complete